MSENRLVYINGQDIQINLFSLYVLPIFYDLRGEIQIKIDREYSSNWWEETKYLMEHNIKYTFVKEIVQDGQKITTWKFKKSPYLFHVLEEFYNNVYSK